jgi:hypothetical protein
MSAAVMTSSSTIKIFKESIGFYKSYSSGLSYKKTILANSCFMA